jgi:enhancing lycopene biosynthesis protein 2
VANIAIILSGCGVFDGAEIHESVLTMLALEENGASYQCFAPQIDQHHVINHISGEEMAETRNVLTESARLCRGNIKPVTELNAQDYDGLIFPGGFGAAKNLTNFAFQGKDCAVEAETLRAAQSFVSANKPIGFICIAPVMIPLIVGTGIELTIGDDEKTALAIESMGGKHICCPVTQFVVDKQHKIVSTPAYMLANNLSEANSGIKKLVNQVLAMA